MAVKRTLTFRCAQCEMITRAIAIWPDFRTPARVRCANCGRRYQLSASRPRRHSDRGYYMRVKKLAEELRLDLATAYSVAEGIMSPASALAYRTRAQAPQVRPRSSPLGYLLPLLLIAAGFVGYAFRIWNKEDGPGPVQAPPVTGAAVTAPAQAAPAEEPEAAPTNPGPAPRFVVSQGDDAGNLIHIAGPDPASILLAFCTSGPGAERREPVGVAPAPPPDTGMKLGIYLDRDDLSTPLAIRIYKDPRTRRWMAGDGRTPITGIDAGDVSATTKIVSVRPKRQG